MADNTLIEWTEATWNPIRARLRSNPPVVGWHCEHASPGCEHCYSETRNLSGRCNLGTKLPFKPGHRADVEIYLDEKVLMQPLRWKRPRQIFVCSMTDLFGAFVTDEMLDRVFAVMALSPQHTFQVLTKRSARMREYLSGEAAIRGIANAIQPMRTDKEAVGPVPHLDGGERWWPLPNVWLGVSVEDQQRADERVPDLLATPAAVRWLSCEPLLGPVRLDRLDDPADHSFYIDALTGDAWDDVNGGLNQEIWGADEGPKLDWIVAGGESGPGARGSTDEVEAWMRSLRDQCQAASVPFFGKQNYHKLPLPEDLLVREFPHAR